MSTLEKVQMVIEQETGEAVTPDTKMYSLVTDSLEMASLIQALEDSTGRDIPDEEAQRLFTVRDVVNYVEAH
jgi:acyl carrier protein